MTNIKKDAQGDHHATRVQTSENAKYFLVTPAQDEEKQEPSKEANAPKNNADKNVVVLCHWFNGSSHQIAHTEEKEKLRANTDIRQNGLTAHSLSEALEKQGFPADIAVVSYGRLSTFNPRIKNEDYVEKVASVVNDLLDKGYKKENITLYGMSKGAFVAASSAKATDVKKIVLDQPVWHRNSSMALQGKGALSKILGGTKLDFESTPAPKTGVKVMLRQSAKDSFGTTGDKAQIADHLLQKWEKEGVKIEGVVDDEIHFPRAPLAAAMIAHVNGIETALETAPSLQQKDMQQMEVWAKALPEITRSSGQGRG